MTVGWEIPVKSPSLRATKFLLIITQPSALVMEIALETMIVLVMENGLAPIAKLDGHAMVFPTMPPESVIIMESVSAKIDVIATSIGTNNSVPFVLSPCATGTSQLILIMSAVETETVLDQTNVIVIHITAGFNVRRIRIIIATTLLKPTKRCAPEMEIVLQTIPVIAMENTLERIVNSPRRGRALVFKRTFHHLAVTTGHVKRKTSARVILGTVDWIVKFGIAMECRKTILKCALVMVTVRRRRRALVILIIMGWIVTTGLVGYTDMMIYQSVLNMENVLHTTIVIVNLVILIHFADIGNVLDFQKLCLMDVALMGGAQRFKHAHAILDTPENNVIFMCVTD
ncbi:MAG: hypothetical protein ACTSUE_14010 [Promethearchaeota archaeon]